MEKKILDFLKKCGIPAHILGYRYLAEAIKLCKEDWGYITQVTKRLYPQIAKNCGTTATRVERAIRHAIESSFNNLDPDTMYEIFGNTISYERGKPTNSHFVATLTELIDY